MELYLTPPPLPPLTLFRVTASPAEVPGMAERGDSRLRGEAGDADALGEDDLKWERMSFELFLGSCRPGVGTNSVQGADQLRSRQLF